MKFRIVKTMMGEEGARMFIGKLNRGPEILQDRS